MSEEAQMRTIQSCRLCLAPDNECISIFNSYAADKEPISSKIYNCVGIKSSYLYTDCASLASKVLFHHMLNHACCCQQRNETQRNATTNSIVVEEERQRVESIMTTLTMTMIATAIASNDVVSHNGHLYGVLVLALLCYGLVWLGFCGCDSVLYSICISERVLPFSIGLAQHSTAQNSVVLYTLSDIGCASAVDDTIGFNVEWHGIDSVSDSEQTSSLLYTLRASCESTIFLSSTAQNSTPDEQLYCCT